jgi:hypothetical protein
MQMPGLKSCWAHDTFKTEAQPLYSCKHSKKGAIYARNLNSGTGHGERGTLALMLCYKNEELGYHPSCKIVQFHKRFFEIPILCFTSLSTPTSYNPCYGPMSGISPVRSAEKESHIIGTNQGQCTLPWLLPRSPISSPDLFVKITHYLCCKVS